MIDIVIVGYRSEEYLPRLFEDIKSTTRAPHSVHFSDNTGNPKTLSTVWNDLAARGSSPYIAVLNPDIALSPDWDIRMVRCLEKDRGTGIATADPVPSSLDIPSRETMVAISKERESVFSTSRDPVQFFAVMMSRQVWVSLKGVDERMRFYMQDIDFIVRTWERLRKTTVRVHGCPIWHKGSASTKEATKRLEINTDLECAHGSRVFHEVRHGMLKEWDFLSENERLQVRQDPKYNTMGR